MAKAKLNVESDSLSGSASKVMGVAAQARHDVTAAFGGGRHLESFASGAFSTLINGVIAPLESQLPQDIEQLIESYARALLALDSSTTATDQNLAQKAKADRSEPPAK